MTQNGFPKDAHSIEIYTTNGLQNIPNFEQISQLFAQPKKYESWRSMNKPDQIAIQYNNDEFLKRIPLSDQSFIQNQLLNEKAPEYRIEHVELYQQQKRLKLDKFEQAAKLEKEKAAENITFFPLVEKVKYKESTAHYDKLQDNKVPQDHAKPSHAGIEIEPRQEMFPETQLCQVRQSSFTIYNKGTSMMYIEYIQPEQQAIQIDFGDKDSKDIKLAPGEKRVYLYDVIPEKLGKQKYVINIKMKGKVTYLYLIEIRGIPNQFRIEPIVEHIQSTHLSTFPIKMYNPHPFPVFIDGYEESKNAAHAQLQAQGVSQHGDQIEVPGNAEMKIFEFKYHANKSGANVNMFIGFSIASENGFQMSVNIPMKILSVSESILLWPEVIDLGIVYPDQHYTNVAQIKVKNLSISKYIQITDIKTLPYAVRTFNYVFKLKEDQFPVIPPNSVTDIGIVKLLPFQRGTFNDTIQIFTNDTSVEQIDLMVKANITEPPLHIDGGVIKINVMDQTSSLEQVIEVKNIHNTVVYIKKILVDGNEFQVDTLFPQNEFFIKIKPKQTVKIAKLKIPRKITKFQVTRFMTIFFDQTHMNIPIQIYDNKLRCEKDMKLQFHNYGDCSDGVEIDYGDSAVGKSKRIEVKFYNENPDPITLHFENKSNKVKPYINQVFDKKKRSQNPYNQEAIQNVLTIPANSIASIIFILNSSKAGKDDVVLRLRTDYEHIQIRAMFEIVEGSLTFIPSHIRFNPGFPGLIQERFISATSQFDRTLKIIKSESYDEKIKVEVMVNELQPNQKTDIIKLIFDPSNDHHNKAINESYMPNRSSRQPIQTKDLIHWRNKQLEWDQMISQGKTEISTSIIIQTDLVQEHEYKVKAQLSKPELSKSEEIDFGIVQVGQKRTQEITIMNPSNEDIQVSLYLGNGLINHYKMSKLSPHQELFCQATQSPNCQSGGPLFISDEDHIGHIKQLTSQRPPQNYQKKKQMSLIQKIQDYFNYEQKGGNMPFNLQTPFQKEHNRDKNNEIQTEQQFFFQGEITQQNIKIAPQQNKTLSAIVFQPNVSKPFNATIFIQNSLTCLYAVELYGEGGAGDLEIYQIQHKDSTGQTRISSRNKSSENSKVIDIQLKPENFDLSKPMDIKNFQYVQKYQRTLVAQNIGNLPMKIKGLTIDFRGNYVDGIEVLDHDKNFEIKPDTRHEIVINIYPDFVKKNIYRTLYILSDFNTQEFHLNITIDSDFVENYNLKGPFTDFEFQKREQYYVLSLMFIILAIVFLFQQIIAYLRFSKYNQENSPYNRQPLKLMKPSPNEVPMLKQEILCSKVFTNHMKIREQFMNFRSEGLDKMDQAIKEVNQLVLINKRKKIPIPTPQVVHTAHQIKEPKPQVINQVQQAPVQAPIQAPVQFVRPNKTQEVEVIPQRESSNTTPQASISTTPTNSRTQSIQETIKKDATAVGGKKKQRRAQQNKRGVTPPPEKGIKDTRSSIQSNEEIQKKIEEEKQLEELKHRTQQLLQTKINKNSDDEDESKQEVRSNMSSEKSHDQISYQGLAGSQQNFQPSSKPKQGTQSFSGTQNPNRISHGQGQQVQKAGVPQKSKNQGAQGNWGPYGNTSQGRKNSGNDAALSAQSSGRIHPKKPITGKQGDFFQTVTPPNNEPVKQADPFIEHPRVHIGEQETKKATDYFKTPITGTKSGRDSRVLSQNLEEEEKETIKTTEGYMDTVGDELTFHKRVADVVDTQADFEFPPLPTMNESVFNPIPNPSVGKDDGQEDEFEYEEDLSIPNSGLISPKKALNSDDERRDYYDAFKSIETMFQTDSMFGQRFFKQAEKSRFGFEEDTSSICGLDALKQDEDEEWKDE